MTMKSTRGAIDPLTLTIMGGSLALGLFWPNLRPWNWPMFQPKPPTAALASAQADLEKARAEAAAAQAALAAAQQAELERKDAQLRYAQQMAAGATESLTRATPEPAVQLALSLLDRTNHGLAAAIGDLPSAQQAEILRVVAESLSGLSADLAKANATLAARDRELAIATTERADLRAQLPALQNKLAEKETIAATATATVAKKTQEVVAYAEQVAAKEREAGSLTAQVNSLGRILLIVALGYLFVHFVLPSLAQEFPGSRVLSYVNKAAKSIASAHE